MQIQTDYAGETQGATPARVMVTDFRSEKPEFPTVDADSIERMVQLRAALVADMRHTTAANAKG